LFVSNVEGETDRHTLLLRVSGISKEATRRVGVGWFLGFFSTTLEVTDDTHIAVEGSAKGPLDMIREGDRVQATREATDGKNVAKAIAVGRDDEKMGMSNRTPDQTTSSPTASPQRSVDPASGGGPATQ
jgi:hypothetical protein